MAVRTGVLRGLQTGIDEAIWNAIGELKAEFVKHASLYGELERLRLLTLEAEAYHENGKFIEAARTLEPVWHRLEPRLREWSATHPLGADDDRGLLRQKIWALLDYVFFAYCRVSGKQIIAVEYFQKLEAIIKRELKRKGAATHGVLALCHYYIGTCNNVLSSAEAERNLLEAQKQTYARALRKSKDESQDDKERRYTEIYKNIFAGRILAGLARVAIQQGHLVRAEHLLYAAQNLHLETKKNIKRFVSFLLWTVARRRADFRSPNYQEAIKNLLSLFDTYEASKDPAGQVRCAAELAYGYLDWAEFGDERPRASRLDDAQYWLNHISDRSPIETDRFRGELQRIRLFLLKGMIDDAHKHLEKLRNAASNDLLAECGIEMDLMQVTYWLQEEPPKFHKARKLAEQILDKIKSNRSGDAREGIRHDSVLEAECCLLLARIELEVGTIAAAQKYLNDWSIIGQFIDNRNCHYLADTLQKQIASRTRRFESKFDLYDPKTDTVLRKILPDCLDDYERWLIGMLRNYGFIKDSEIARFYNLDPSNVNRRLKRLRAGHTAKPRNRNREAES